MVPAVEEQRRVIARHGPGITLEALNEMEVLHRNVQEAVRLFPPLILLLRQVHKDFTVTTSTGATYLVPKASPPHLTLSWHTCASVLQHCPDLTLLTSSLLAMRCVCLAVTVHTALGTVPLALAGPHRCDLPGLCAPTVVRVCPAG